jgi:dolichyl-phosphate-mannose--protein O-mannosyl transferase
MCSLGRIQVDDVPILEVKLWLEEVASRVLALIGGYVVWRLLSSVSMLCIIIQYVRFLILRFIYIYSIKFTVFT